VTGYVTFRSSEMSGNAIAHPDLHSGSYFNHLKGYSMTNIRRYHLENHAIFITAVCQKRKPNLSREREKNLLLDIMQEVKVEMPYRLSAYVILDDHFHCILRPEAGSDYSRIVQSIKLRFTHRWKRERGITTPINLWQRRFWDHLIRDVDDLHRHLDYIHYNPVKHGYVLTSADYLWSSFKVHQAKGRYPPDWGNTRIPEAIKSLDFE
jgi:putative transposase